MVPYLHPLFMTSRTIVYSCIGVLVIASALFFYFIYFKKDSPSPQRETATTTTKETVTIAAFGDSLTAGYGVDLTESYPYLLEKKLLEKNIKVNILNMGVSGETTQGGLDRVSFILEQNPDIILLGLGANDMLRSLPPSLVRDNLDAMLKTFTDANKKVVLLGMKSSITNGSAYRQEFDSIYEDLAKKYNVPLVPFFLSGVALRSSLNISDGIHPNKAGYEKIIDDNILPVLLPYLKKSGIY